MRRRITPILVVCLLIAFANLPVFFGNGPGTGDRGRHRHRPP